MEAEDDNHSWLDSVTSFGALVGLAGAAFGYRSADPVAGLAVTLFILARRWEVTREILAHGQRGGGRCQSLRQAVPSVDRDCQRGEPETVEFHSAWH